MYEIRRAWKYMDFCSEHGSFRFLSNFVHGRLVMWNWQVSGWSVGNWGWRGFRFLHLLLLQVCASHMSHMLYSMIWSKINAHQLNCMCAQITAHRPLSRCRPAGRGCSGAAAAMEGINGEDPPRHGHCPATHPPQWQVDPILPCCDELASRCRCPAFCNCHLYLRRERRGSWKLT
jgi:hypothetical protein